MARKDIGVRTAERPDEVSPRMERAQMEQAQPVLQQQGSPAVPHGAAAAAQMTGATAPAQPGSAPRPPVFRDWASI